MGFTLQILGVLIWFVLALAGLSPKSHAIRYQFAALGMALLFCLGPLGNVGVTDLRSYWWDPYMQPGLFMTEVSGGLIAARLWWRARCRFHNSHVNLKFDLPTVAIILACSAALYHISREQTPGILDRIRAQGKPLGTDLEDLMLAVAHDYPAYRHAEGEPSYDYRFAPRMCKGSGGAIARISDSADTATHGDKLYTIYAKRRDAYMATYYAKSGDLKIPLAQLADQPAGQVIVKESFTPEESTRSGHSGQSMHAAYRDGKFYLPGSRRDLFVMINLGSEIANTDAGWVYGTLSPDYQHVTSVGQIQSCMKCHDEAPYGKLFGLPLSDWEKQAVARRSSTAPALLK